MYDPGIPNWSGGDAWHVNPKDKGPKIPRRMKGKWDKGSVEQDLFTIQKTKKILDGSEYATVTEKSVSLKKNIKRELEPLGWIYQRRATFMANFPFRSKYLIFDFAFAKMGAWVIHKIKVVMGNNGVSGYLLTKWVPKY